MKFRVAALDRFGAGLLEPLEPAGAPASGDRAPRMLPGEIVEGTPPQLRILTPVPERVAPPCPHYGECGGCALMHADDAFVADFKTTVVSRALARQGVPAPAPALHTSPSRSRRRAVLGGRRTRKGAIVGFHGRASNRLVNVTDCQVVTPGILAALPLLREVVAAGASRDAELTLTLTQTDAGLDLAVAGGKPADGALLERLAGLAAQGDLARLTWDSVPLTRRPPGLPFGRARVVPPPGAFLQATAEGEAALLAAVRAATAGAARILDLYAGIGTFTLPLAETAEVHAVEGLSAALAALDTGWRQAPGLRRVTTQARDLVRRPLAGDELAGFDAAVIDPPRAGAAMQATALAQAPARLNRIAWVSCDPVTFAQDAQTLAGGGWRLARLDVVDQFRWSHHIETVAAFVRT